MGTILPNAMQLLQSSLFADSTVKCEQFEWKVHQAILASGSKFFEKAFSGNFREAADKIIIFHDDKPEMVARMLLCLYTSSYPVEFSERGVEGSSSVKDFLSKGCPPFKADSFEAEENDLMVHSEMYAMAEKYIVPGLQALCVTKFAISENPSKRELQDLVKALPHVYTSTPPSSTALRLKAAALVQEAYSGIMYNAELETLLKSAWLQNGQLGWDVWSTLFTRWKFQCKDCGEEEQQPYKDVFRMKSEAGVCVCGLTKLCGSLACSKLIEENWPCSACMDGRCRMMPVVKEC